MKKYDLIVIGGGSAGLTSAITANGLGKKVLIIERWKIGGECTHYGCVPSKALIKESENKDILKVNKKVEKAVEEIFEEEKKTLKEKGIDVVSGMASIEDKHIVKVKEEKYYAKKIIVATGSIPRVPEIDGIKEVNYLTNKTIFNLDKIPKKMVVIGAGPIGMEMAYSFKNLGSEVKVLLRDDKILTKEDEEISMMAKYLFKEQGIEFIDNANIKSVEDKKVILEDGEVEYDKLLLATGRVPDFSAFKNIDIKFENKKLKVDKYLRTSIKNIYVAGDVVGPYGLSHMAEYQAIKATLNAFLPFKKKVNYENVLWVTYTKPEIAHLGLTEKEVKNKNIKYKVYREYFRNLDRAITEDKKEGVVKVIVDKKGYVLGAHIIGHNAGELIHEFQVVKSMNIKLAKLSDVIHSYPTYSGIVKKIARQVKVDRIKNNIFIKIIRKIFGK